jgi:uncharacterized membrane protein
MEKLPLSEPEKKSLSEFLSHEQQDAILAAIARAESQTSGEIRLRLDVRAGDDPKVTARQVFDRLGMRQTALRNGVLFYMSVEDRKFVILGDDGIYHKVAPNFWDGVTGLVLEHFRQGRYAEGLVAGIEKAGDLLARYFPREATDVNELPDDISLGLSGAIRKPTRPQAGP